MDPPELTKASAPRRTASTLLQKTRGSFRGRFLKEMLSDSWGSCYRRRKSQQRFWIHASKMSRSLLAKCSCIPGGAPYGTEKAVGGKLQAGDPARSLRIPRGLSRNPDPWQSPVRPVSTSSGGRQPGQQDTGSPSLVTGKLVTTSPTSRVGGGRCCERRDADPSESGGRWHK